MSFHGDNFNAVEFCSQEKAVSLSRTKRAFFIRLKRKLLAEESLQSQSGMTLVEVIAVVVLIALIFGVVAKGVFTAAGGAKTKLNGLQMDKVVAMLQQYNLEMNHYPSKLSELVKGASNGTTTYIGTASEKDIKDVYDNDFSYTAEGNGRSFTLKSLGADKADGGSGDNADMIRKP